MVSPFAVSQNQSNELILRGLMEGGGYKIKKINKRTNQGFVFVSAVHRSSLHGSDVHVLPLSV